MIITRNLRPPAITKTHTLATSKWEGQWGRNIEIGYFMGKKKNPILEKVKEVINYTQQVTRS